MSANADKARSLFAYLIAAVGAFLIVAAVVWGTRKLVQPPPLSEDRVATRLRSLAEVRAAEAQALTTVGWIDQTKGVVRLPIETALVLTERTWQNPAQARSNLIARVEKATFVPPPLPEKPSVYE